MATLGTIALEGSKYTADYYNSLSTGGKIGLAMTTTLFGPVFWIALVIIVLIVSVIVWLYAPCWARNVKDPYDRDCNGWAPPSYWRSLWMTLLIVTLPLFIIFTAIAYFLQSSAAGIIGGTDKGTLDSLSKFL